MKKQTPFFLLLVVLSVLAGCTKNTSTGTLFVCGTSTVTDIDGNVYHTVSIGSQCWTVENLKTSKYNDGTSIPTGLSDIIWAADTLGAFAIWNNDTANNTIYGKLYNWFAVKTGKLNIKGWHVPDTTERSTLRNFTGGPLSGGKLKSLSSLWALGNVGASNSTGFTALPSAMRQQAGGFASLSYEGDFWTTVSESSITASAFRMLGADSSFQFIGSVKNRGYAVRLIKE